MGEEEGNIADLSRIIDIHVHTFPDVRPRRVTDLSLAEEARSAGAKALVIKSHFFPTMERAWVAEQLVPEVAMFGGITLNPSVGGLNRAAVEAAIRLGAKIVWLPTLFSSRHRRMEGKSGGIESVAGNRVVPELLDILKLVAEHNLILSTGHLSSREVAVVVEAAANQGIRKLLVTHPEHQVVGMTVMEQKRLAADFPVVFERCYAQPAGGGSYKLNFSENLLAIREVGYASTIVSTDCGQVENPPWSEALGAYIDYLASHGVAEHEIRWMTRSLPAQLLDLKDDKEAQ